MRNNMAKREVSIASGGEADHVLARRGFLRLAAGGTGSLAVMAFGLAACGGGGSDVPTESALRSNGAAPASKPALDAPTLSCFDRTQSSITVRFTAPASGAPAGFSLQWMKKTDFDLHGWSEGESIALCAAGFSGNANLSRYDLAASESVNVVVGDFLFDNGASTDCVDPLECGVTYVFRAFSHANSDFKKSDWSANLECATLSCTQVAACTYTQGYWKTHGPVPVGGNTNTWPVSSLVLGSVAYTDLELLSIFNTPAAGNGLIVLAHQLMATKLNLANGTDPMAIAAAVSAADALIGSMTVPPIGSASLHAAATSSLTKSLADYNEGGTGPGHCS
jgi:hypothetical protein